MSNHIVTTCNKSNNWPTVPLGRTAPSQLLVPQSGMDSIWCYVCSEMKIS